MCSPPNKDFWYTIKKVHSMDSYYMESSLYYYYENFDLSALYSFKRLFYRTAFRSNIVYFDVLCIHISYEAVATWLTKNQHTF